MNCPLCNNQNNVVKLFAGNDRLLGGQEHFDVLFCYRCQLGITKIITNVDYFSMAYPQEYYSRILQLSNQQKDVRSQLEIILQHSAIQKKKILEIGCADGSLMDLLHNYGSVVFGIEPSNYAAEFALSKGLKIFKNIDQVDERNFDMIILFDVIEHLPDPVEQLQKMKLLLNNNGMILMGLPNFGSLEAKILRSQWFALELPRHLWHHTPQSIELLATKSFFTLKSITYPEASFFYNSFFDKRLKEQQTLSKTAFAISIIKGVKRIVKTLEYLLNYLGNHPYMVVCLVNE